MVVAQDLKVAIVEAWRDPVAQAFFRNVWPMYVHEISGFDTHFYALDETGRWMPDLVEDWISSTTRAQNMRVTHAEQHPAQPFQRTHVITVGRRPVGFACVGAQPFKHMPEDADLNVAEFFLIHASRGTGTAALALDLLLRQYSGRWHLRAIHDNARAIRFWRKVLPVIGARNLEESREDGDVVFRFVTGDGRARGV